MEDKNPKRRKLTDDRSISGTENRVSADAEERSDSPDRVAVADPAAARSDSPDRVAVADPAAARSDSPDRVAVADPAAAFRISRIFEGYDMIFNILNHLGERERPRYILLNRTWRTVFVESQKRELFYFRRPSRVQEERLARYLLQYLAPDEMMTSMLIRMFLLTRNNPAMGERFKSVSRAFAEFCRLRRLTKRGRSDDVHGYKSLQSLLKEPRI